MKFNSIDEIQNKKKELDEQYEGGLPDYLLDYLDHEEIKKIRADYFSKLHLKRWNTPSEERYQKLQNYWETYKSEIVKRPKRTKDPVFSEPDRALTRVDQERELTHSERQALLQICEKDMYLFAVRYFPHYLKKPSSELHRYLYRRFSLEFGDPTRRRFAGLKLAIAAPRSNSKSSIVNGILIIWCAVYKKKNFIIMLSDTARQAEDFLSDVKRELESNALLMRDFPHVCGKGPTWRTNEIIIRNNIKIMSLGTGNNIRGRKFGEHRPDLICGDDLEASEMVRSETQRNSIRYDWFDKDVMFVGGDEEKTDFIVIGTIISRHSLLYALTSQSDYPDWEKKIFKAVTKQSQSPLWDKWAELYKNRFDANRTRTALRFFNENKEEMLKGTEVLWPEGDPYYNLMVWKYIRPNAYFCFLPQTEIVLANGDVKKIAEINRSDKLLQYNDHDSCTYPLSIFKRKTKSKIIKIKIVGIPDVICATEEHPFLVWPKIKYSNIVLTHLHLNTNLYVGRTDKRKETINNRINNNDIIWKKAIDLQKGDAVVYPVPPTNNTCINCNKDWWWLVGYYLAEGFINYHNHAISFSAHLNEKHYLDKTVSICKKLGYGRTYTIRKQEEADCLFLIVCSKKLSDKLKLFGRYSHGKFLSDEVNFICNDCFKSLWDGYIAGDGYTVLNRKANYVAVNSASKKLLLGFQQNLLKVGIISYLYNSRKAGIGQIRGRYFKAKQLYSLQAVGSVETDRTAQAWINKGLLYSRIQDITIDDSNTEKEVYGIETTGTHTYCVPHAVVKNSEKQNDPKDLEKIIVHEDQLHFENFTSNRDVKAALQRSMYFGALDPSLGKKTSDDSAIVITARDIQTGYIFVIDILLKKRSVDEQIDEILDLHLKYKFRAFGVETNAFQLVVAENLRKKSRKKGYYVPVREMPSFTDKKMRFEGIVPFITDGTVVFDTYRRSHNQSYNKGIEEITYFTGEGDEEDDAVDGLTMAVEIAKKPRFKLLTKQARKR